MKVASTIALLLFLTACNSTPTTGPRATVQLRDGGTVSGMVVSSTAEEVRVIGDDNIAHAIPMTQVRSIDYADAAATATAAPAAAPTMSGSPAVTPPATATYELPRGTRISVRINEAIDSARAAEGQRFAAEVTDDVRNAEGKVLIPDGAHAQVIIKSAAGGGTFKGQADLILDLATVSVDGKRYAVSTRDVEEKGHQGLGKNKRTAEFVGGGAAVGGVLGAIFGGGKGAAIGAGAGAGGGVLAQAATKGGSIKVPAETILTFKLDAPLKVIARP